VPTKTTDLQKKIAQKEAEFLRARIRQKEADRITGEMGATGVFINKAGESFGNAALKATEPFRDFAGAISVMQRASPSLLPFGETFPEALARESFAESPLTGEITVPQVGAALRSVPSLLPGGATPGDRYEEELAQFQADDAAMRDQYPIAATGGDVAGDVAAMLTMRRGAAPAIKKFENMLKTGRVFSSLPKGTRGLKGVIADVLNSKPLRSFGRGAFRVGEAGVEGAVAGWLNDTSSSESAMLAAGVQAGNSLGISIAKEVFDGVPGNNKLTQAAFAAILAGAAWKFAGEFIPGEDPSVLSSLETGFDKAAFVMTVGAMMGLTGGRLRGTQFSNRAPVLSDQLAAIPRNALQTILSDIFATPDNEREALLVKLENLSKEDLESLGPSVNNGTFITRLKEMIVRDAEVGTADREKKQENLRSFDTLDVPGLR
jgi:hypothetical protein